MARKNAAPKQGRGDGGWLALFIAILTMCLGYERVFGLAEWIMEEHLRNLYYDAEYLIIPMFGLCMLIGVLALTVALRFLPQLALILAFSRR